MFYWWMSACSRTLLQRLNCPQLFDATAQGSLFGWAKTIQRPLQTAVPVSPLQTVNNGSGAES
jgi:hypothetical protein